MRLHVEPVSSNVLQRIKLLCISKTSIVALGIKSNELMLDVDSFERLTESNDGHSETF